MPSQEMARPNQALTKQSSEISLPAPLTHLVDDDFSPRGVLFIGCPRPPGWCPPPELGAEETKLIPQGLEILKQGLRETPREVMYRHLTGMCAVLVLKDVPEEIWSARMDAFYENTKEIPEDIFDATCKWWIKNKIYWPTIAEFREIAIPAYEERKREYRRVKILARISKNPRGSITKEWLDEHGIYRGRGEGVKRVGDVLDGLMPG